MLKNLIGGDLSYGGVSFVNTAYDVTLSTAWTLTQPPAATGAANGTNGQIKITDGAGTTTYSYTSSATQTHTVT